MPVVRLQEGQIQIATQEVCQGRNMAYSTAFAQPLPPLPVGHNSSAGIAAAGEGGVGQRAELGQGIF